MCPDNALASPMGNWTPPHCCILITAPVGQAGDPQAGLDKKLFTRSEPFEKRRDTQIKTPPFPTTTIGSFPQTAGVPLLQCSSEDIDACSDRVQAPDMGLAWQWSQSSDQFSTMSRKLAAG